MTREEELLRQAKFWEDTHANLEERYFELKQEVQKYIFWHDKFFNDTIVGQPPSLQPLRDLITHPERKKK